MKRTKIICTIGPVSESQEMIKKMAGAGMNVCRLNFSHGDFEEHGNRIINIRAVSKEIGRNIAILLDTKGPEVRCGEFANDAESYEAGDMITLVREKIMGTKERLHIQCPEIFDDVVEGGTILIDDGKVRLTIMEKRDGELDCRIENPGVLKSKKGCNLPGVKLTMPFISEKDENDIRFGCRNDVDFIAASFTRRKQDILDIRKILKEEGKEHIQIIAKIENQEGYDNLDEILSVVDGIMVARGDLGVDVSFDLVPMYQKAIINRCNELGKPVITATHMLETMQGNPRPTRAEASDVANAVLDGTDATMLSGESAAGLYPIEAVTTMARIADTYEQMIPYRERLKKSMKDANRTVNDAIAISVADTTLAIDVACVVVFTESGASARRISKYRPNCPIIAVTFDEKVERGLAVNWGVNTVLSQKANTRELESQMAKDVAKAAGFKPGESIIIVAGYPSGVGATNAMRIIEIK